MIIIINSVILAINDYKGRIEPEHFSPRESLVNNTDPIFLSIFLAEFLIKIIAMGFIFEKKTYLRDGYHVLDFIVVISG